MKDVAILIPNTTKIFYRITGEFYTYGHAVVHLRELGFGSIEARRFLMRLEKIWLYELPKENVHEFHAVAH